MKRGIILLILIFLLIPVVEAQESTETIGTAEVVTTVKLEKTSSPVTPWIFALVLAGIGLSFFFILSKKRKKKNLLAPIIKEKTIISGTENDFNMKVKKIFNEHSHKTGVKAIIPTLIFGNKQPITSLFLRIDGINSLKRLSNESPRAFEKILNDYFSIVIDKIRTYHGVAEIHNNTLFIIFNAIKQYSHEMAAIKAAEEIRNETINFNERFKPLAKFYVASGINTGRAIISTIGEDKTLKYLSLENTTQIAKELEQKANSNEILISQNTYSRLKNSIDVKKTGPLFINNKEAIETYNLEQLSLRDKYKDRIDKIVRDFKKY